MHKFLHTGYPKYFSPFLKPKRSVFKMHKSQDDGVFFEVPHFANLVSTKHFDIRFAIKIWNDLPDDVCLSTHSERTSKPISFQKHINPNFSFLAGIYFGIKLLGYWAI